MQKPKFISLHFDLYNIDQLVTPSFTVVSNKYKR